MSKKWWLDRWNDLVGHALWVGVVYAVLSAAAIVRFGGERVTIRWWAVIVLIAVVVALIVHTSYLHVRVRGLGKQDDARAPLKHAVLIAQLIELRLACDECAATAWAPWEIGSTFNSILERAKRESAVPEIISMDGVNESYGVSSDIDVGDLKVRIGQLIVLLTHDN